MALHLSYHSQFVCYRFIGVAMAIFTSLFAVIPAPVWQILVLTILAATMSASIQALHRKLVEWLERPSVNKIFSTFCVVSKRYLIFFCYNFVLFGVSASMGIEPWMNWPVLFGVTLVALGSQGVWDMLIASQTIRLTVQHPRSSVSIWRASAFVTLMVSIIFTALGTLYLLGARGALIASLVLGTLGWVLYVALVLNQKALSSREWVRYRSYRIMMSRRIRRLVLRHDPAIAECDVVQISSRSLRKVGPAISLSNTNDMTDTAFENKKQQRG